MLNLFAWHYYHNYYYYSSYYYYYCYSNKTQNKTSKQVFKRGMAGRRVETRQTGTQPCQKEQGPQPLLSGVADPKNDNLAEEKKNIKKNQCLLEGKMRRRGEYPIATVRTLSLREICIAAAPVSQSESRSSTCLCNAFYDWCTRPDSRFLGALHLTV